MTPQELADACRERQRACGRADATVILVLPGTWPRKSDRKRLAGRQGPYGDCVMLTQEGQLIVHFRADKVLEYLIGKGVAV